MDPDYICGSCNWVLAFIAPMGQVGKAKWKGRSSFRVGVVCIYDIDTRNRDFSIMNGIYTCLWQVINGSTPKGIFLAEFLPSWPISLAVVSFCSAVNGNII